MKLEIPQDPICEFYILVEGGRWVHNLESRNPPFAVGMIVQSSKGFAKKWYPLTGWSTPSARDFEVLETLRKAL